MNGLRWIVGLSLALVVPAAHANAIDLFEDVVPLSIVLTGPLSDLNKSNPEVEATLTWAGKEEKRKILPLKLSLRGKSRLKECRFPPLRLNFKRGTLLGTPFEGQNKLKLVTQCRRQAKYRDYLALEFTIYRSFNLVTDKSLRVRWLNIVYRDSLKNGRDAVHPGFLIEDVGRAAARLGLEEYKTATLRSRFLDPTHAAQVALFNFLIGNTDWSALAAPAGEDCCHNGKPLVQPGTVSPVYVVPYDFDQAGLINAEYARPGASLPIRSVRTRLYRGLCRFNAALPAAMAELNAQRSAIAALIASADLSRMARRSTLTYLDSFFDTINTPQAAEKHIYRKCRG